MRRFVLGATAEPVRHRQTKGAATDMFDLKPPRHISTLRYLVVGTRNGQGPGSTRADLRPKKKLGLGHCETPPPRRSARRLGQASGDVASRMEGPQSGRDCFAGTRDDGSSSFMPCRGAPTPPGSAPRSTPGSMLSARSTRPRPNSAGDSAHRRERGRARRRQVARRGVPRVGGATRPRRARGAGGAVRRRARGCRARSSSTERSR
jgi:hypothetical protein